MHGLLIAIFIIGTAMAAVPPKPKPPVINRGLLALLDKYVNENKRQTYQGPPAPGDYGNYGSGDYGNYGSGDYGNYGSGDYGNYGSGDYGNYGSGDYGNYGYDDYGNYDYNDTDDMGCKNVTPPCKYGKDDDAFYRCAFSKLRDTEEAIRRIVKEKFGENLFDDFEMDIVWELRKDWKISIEMKEVVEVVFMEIAEARYSKYDWDKVDTATKEAVKTKICEYFWLREQTFEHGKFFHTPRDRKGKGH